MEFFSKRKIFKNSGILSYFTYLLFNLTQVQYCVQLSLDWMSSCYNIVFGWLCCAVFSSHKYPADICGLGLWHPNKSLSSPLSPCLAAQPCRRKLSAYTMKYGCQMSSLQFFQLNRLLYFFIFRSLLKDCQKNWIER